MHSSLTNNFGEFTLDIYQPVNNLIERFADGPLDLSNYECAITECYLPRLVYPLGQQCQVVYQLTGGQPSIISFAPEPFDTLSHMLKWLSRQIGHPDLFR